MMRRVSAFRRATIRSFSASSAGRSSLVEFAVAPPTDLLDTLHNAGLPWCAAIPMSAVIVRGVIVYYLSTRPQRKVAQIQSHLTPLASVRAILRVERVATMAKREKLATKGGLVGALLMSRPGAYALRIFATQHELHQLGKQFGAPSWTGKRFLGFGMLIAMTEALRVKCGSREGLLPLLLSPFHLVGRLIAPDQFPPPPPPAPPMSVEEKVAMFEKVRVLGDDGRVSYDLSKLPPKPGVEKAYAEYLDPSVQHEGLSWCLDLSLPDPTLMLPLAVTILMAQNIIFRPNARGHTPIQPNPQATTTEPASPPNPTPDIHDPNRGTAPRKLLSMPILPPITDLQRIGLCFTMAFGFAMLNMPAAILLYFVPSMIIGRLQQRWLRVKYPLPKAIAPCRRPLRLRARRQWRD